MENYFTSSDPHRDKLFYHSFWYSLLAFYLHLFWHPIWHPGTYSHMFSGIADILSGIYSIAFYSAILAFILAFYLYPLIPITKRWDSGHGRRYQGGAKGFDDQCVTQLGTPASALRKTPQLLCLVVKLAGVAKKITICSQNPPESGVRNTL